MLVRKIKTNEVYAMKILSKAKIEARNQRTHTKSSLSKFLNKK